MQRNPDLPSDSECATPQLTRRAALRQGLLLGLGMATIAVSGCAAGGDGDEEDEGD